MVISIAVTDEQAVMIQPRLLQKLSALLTLKAKYQKMGKKISVQYVKREKKKGEIPHYYY